MSFKEKLILADGQTLRHVRSREKGFMGETDETTYDVVDAAGAVVGSVTHERHLAVKGFKLTESVKQRDEAGNVIVDERWNP